jgi:topoisomerase-4 subunit B
MKLVPVISKGKIPIQETLSYYMGKNTPERQQFIIDNLKIEEELLNDNA